MKRLTIIEYGEPTIICDRCPSRTLEFCGSEDCFRELLSRLANIEEILCDKESDEYDVELLKKIQESYYENL